MPNNINPRSRLFNWLRVIPWGEPAETNYSHTRFTRMVFSYSSLLTRASPARLAENKNPDSMLSGVIYLCGERGISTLSISHFSKL